MTSFCWDFLQTRMVFDFFGRLSSQLGHEGCADYAVQLLSPLYRVCEGFSGKVISGASFIFLSLLLAAGPLVLGEKFLPGSSNSKKKN